MGVIYNRDEIGSSKDSYKKQSPEVYRFASFLASQDLGLSKEQLSQLILKYRGREGKTKKDDVFDIYKDLIRDGIKQELTYMWRRGEGSVGQYLAGAYCDNFTKDEEKRRHERYNEFIKELDEITEESLEEWFESFLKRKDIIPVFGDRLTDVFYYLDKKGKPQCITLEVKGMTESYEKILIEECPKDSVPVMYVYNPIIWEASIGSGNQLFWVKNKKLASIGYVPKGSKFDLSWLNNPSN